MRPSARPHLAKAYGMERMPPPTIVAVKSTDASCGEPTVFVPPHTFALPIKLNVEDLAVPRRAGE